jgi:hypothetical protein
MCFAVCNDVDGAHKEPVREDLRRERRAGEGNDDWGELGHGCSSGGLYMLRRGFILRWCSAYGGKGDSPRASSVITGYMRMTRRPKRFGIAFYLPSSFTVRNWNTIPARIPVCLPPDFLISSTNRSVPHHHHGFCSHPRHQRPQPAPGQHQRTRLWVRPSHDIIADHTDLLLIADHAGPILPTSSRSGSAINRLISSAHLVGSSTSPLLLFPNLN